MAGRKPRVVSWAVPRDLKLGAAPEVMKKTGQVLYVGDLAKEYGFTDIDGRWIPPYGLT